MTEPTDLSEMNALIDAVIEGVADAASYARLSEILAEEPAARTYYARYVLMRANLIRMAGGVSSAGEHGDALPGGPEADEPVVPGLGDAAVMPAVWPHYTSDDDVRPAPAYRGPTRIPPTRLPRRLLALAAVLLIAATVVGMLLVRGGGGGVGDGSGGFPAPIARTDPDAQTAPAGAVARGPAVVATVTADAGARWSDPGSGPVVGAALAPGRSLDLAGGFVELSFGGRAKVIIEGPARVSTLESGGAVLLTSGKLVADVPGGGFVVRTPTSTVTDLGTQFGVSAAADGTTSVDVFEGRVRAAPSPAPGRVQEAPPAQVLTAGQAATLSAGAAVAIDPRGVVPQRFVRRLQSKAAVLNVVDLIAGGDGTTRRRDVGIDARNGNAGPLEVVTEFKGDGLYHRVPSLLVVDGCFVPDGRKGPFPVDSAGHTFAFPRTDAKGFNHIWAGTAKSSPPRGMMPISGKMGGTDYSRPDRGMLYMHANLGLTVDLDAIRRLHPNKTPSRFRAMVGHSEPRATDKSSRADVYVLVDGKARFDRRGITPLDDPRQVEVPLGTGDRFLTLAVTDGGDGIQYDGLLWGDPVIDLADASGR
jgi:ferric-dicitrate binding protein FerR (iron transport regulator)